VNNKGNAQSGGIGFNARVISVIVTNLEKKGKGIEDDPVRRIIQYWSLDGILLAEDDTYKPLEGK